MCILGLIFPISHITGAVLRLTNYLPVDEIAVYRQAEPFNYFGQFLDEGKSRSFSSIAIIEGSTCPASESDPLSTRTWDD